MEKGYVFSIIHTNSGRASSYYPPFRLPTIEFWKAITFVTQLRLTPLFMSDAKNLQRIEGINEIQTFLASDFRNRNGNPIFFFI